MTKCQETFEKWRASAKPEYVNYSDKDIWNDAYRAGMERAAEIVWERRETPFDPYEAILKEMEE